MRLLHVCPRFYPEVGGVENVVYNISSRLAKRGHRNHIITTTRDKSLVGIEELFPNLTIERILAFAPGNAYWYSSKVGKRVKDIALDFDIIHGHSYHAFPALQAFSNKKEAGFVLSTYYHGLSHSKFRNFLLGPYKLFTRKMVRGSDAVICISNAEKELLENDFAPRNCRVIHVGTKIPDESKWIIGGKNVVMIGRLERYKNFHHGINAISKIENTNMEIVGTGPERGNLEKLANSLGISNRVTFHGRLEDEQRDRLLKSSLCLLSLSDYESFGIVLIEAIKLGIPAIASDVPSHREIAETLEVGVTLVDQHNPLEISSAIESQLGIHEISDVPKIQRFSWDYLIDEYIGIYETVIHQRVKSA